MSSVLYPGLFGAAPRDCRTYTPAHTLSCDRSAPPWLLWNRCSGWAGAAGFVALVDDAVLAFMLLEQLPSNRAGDPSVLMPDEAADDISLLNLHGDRRVLVAPRQHACVQALLNVLRLLGGTGFLVDFSGNVLEIEDALVLVVLEADVGNRAVYHTLFDVLTAFVPLVGDEFRRLDFQLLLGLLRHPVQLLLIRVGVCRIKGRDEMMLLVHHRLDVVGGLQPLLGVDGAAHRVGLLNLILACLPHALLVALVFTDLLPDLRELLRHILRADIQFKDSGVLLFLFVRMIHVTQVFLDFLFLLAQVVQLLVQNLRCEGFLFAVCWMRESSYRPRRRTSFPAASAPHTPSQNP